MPLSCDGSEKLGVTTVTEIGLDTNETPCHSKRIAKENDMTITITALTNDRAQLIVKKACFQNDERMADVVLGIWEQEGYKVIKHEEC